MISKQSYEICGALELTLSTLTSLNHEQRTLNTEIRNDGRMYKKLTLRAEC